MHQAIFKHRRAFTAIDLLACAAAVVFAGVLALQVCCASKERANRVKCASNLRQIGQGLAIYCNDFKEYPRTTWDASEACKAEFDNAGFDSADGTTVTANNVAAAMFLMVRNSDLNPEVFVCPTSNQEKDTLDGKSVFTRSNFTSGENVSYSFTNPYPRKGAGSGSERGYRWSPDVPADWAIAADRSDGTHDPAVNASSAASLQKPLNSSNHEWEGQNILYNDGHVEWTATPWVGANRDNIYTRAAVVPTAADKPELAFVLADPPATDAERFPEPALDLDSVLVPVWPVSPYRAIDREIGLQWRAALLLVVLGVVAFGAYKAIRRSANPAQAV